LETAAASGKSDLGKLLGASQIGESLLMIENADYVYIVSREFLKSTGELFLTFKQIASRGKDAKNESGTPRYYFVHPFENTMRLREDEGTAKSLSMDGLGDELAKFVPKEDRGGTKKRIRDRGESPKTGVSIDI
jgi:hypothetical protein